MDKKEKQDIARAIVSCGGRVGTAEVVSLTGLPTLTVNRCLNSMAYDCAAHLQVNSDGSLIYLFPQNFDWHYRVGKIQKALSLFLDGLESIFFLGIKIMVGTILVLSVSFVYALSFLVLEIVAVFTKMESATGQMRAEFFELLKYYLQSPFKSESSASRSKTRLPAFLESCFGFLFGPEDPNSELESVSWRQIAGTIRANRGAVIAEQLRVFSRQENDEAFDLSVLVRLDGMPLVTDSGLILYSFPALASQASQRQDSGLPLPALAENAQEQPKNSTFLLENIWHFSGVATRDLIPVLTLALVNLIGCNLAYFGLHALPFIVKQAALYWGITFMWMYGNTFLAFPLIRILICAYRNHRITVRNVTRKLLAEALFYPSSEMQAKLDEASQLALEMSRQADENRLVFTTEMDSLEQSFVERNDRS